MDASKKHYFLKLNPPRPDFAFTMSGEERAVMLRHVDYWGQLLKAGIAIAFGPVFDPAGGYGVGIVAADGEEQLQRLISEDPANGLNRYEYHPMRAVYNQG
jgi:hypothetical protein